MRTLLVRNAKITAVIRDSRKMELCSRSRAVHQGAGPMTYHYFVQHYRVVSFMGLFSSSRTVHQAAELIYTEKRKFTLFLIIMLDCAFID